MKHWLIKSEPGSYSIDDLKRDKRTGWEGVRNYQARNFLQSMEVGDLLLFYHSNTSETGVAGIAKVVRVAEPDPSQYKKGDYFEPRATVEKPVWFCPTLAYVQKFRHIVLLDEIKLDPKLEGMLVRARGSRLSVQPVGEKHFAYICNVLAR